MSDQEQKQETSVSPLPEAETKKKSTTPAQGELTDQELEKVSGGSDIVVTKYIDKSSAKLF
jgi:bacteriocin-like protein